MNISACKLTVLIGDQMHILSVPHGANLRHTLLEAGFSPYTTITKWANCGGRGLCATCGVWIESGEPAPQQWHDRIGSSFGYPRLSCQITITNDMTIRILDDKMIWGGPQWSRRWR